MEFEFNAEAVDAAEQAALRSARISPDPLDAAHAVITALEPFVEKHAQFVRRSVMVGMGTAPQAVEDE